MNKEYLASILDGAQYGDVVGRYRAQTAKENGLVVVYGHSDDLMEFEGALYEEFSGIAYLTADGFLHDVCECDCKYFQEAKKACVTVEAIWGKGEYSFQYKTDIPHATFEVLDGEEKYCKGIVFSMEDLKETVAKRKKI